MSTEPTNSDILLALGGLMSDVKSIRDELAVSRENRKMLYDKLEEQGQSIAKMGVRLQTAHEVSAAARDEAKLIRTEVSPLLSISEDLKSVIVFQKDASKTGKALIWLLTIGGASMLAFAMWFAEQLTAWIKTYLGITPPGP